MTHPPKTDNPMHCIQCGRGYDPASTKTRPFCSSRCQTLDLGRWLNEEVQLPHEGGPEDAAENDSPREIIFDDETETAHQPSRGPLS